MSNLITSKLRGTNYGICIGDSLAMPVHWYYNRQALAADYGWVTDYLPPLNPHPDSILWRSRYTAPSSKGDILHEQARYWGQKDIHYHQFLRAGENTLNIKICRLVVESMNRNGTYEVEDVLKRYVTLVIDLLLKVLNGISLIKAIIKEIEVQTNPLLGHPFIQFLSQPDDWVIGPRFSTACYVEDSVPAVVYLALKYHEDPETALIVNTNLGGDNAARGAVLGALLGAYHGIEKFPDRWVQGLLEPLPDLKLPDRS